MGDDKLQQLIDLLRRLFGGEESASSFEKPAPREYSRSELQRLRDPAIGGLYYKPEDFSTITGFSGLGPYVGVDTPAQYQNIFGTERPSMYVPTFASVDPIGYEQALRTKTFRYPKEQQEEALDVLDTLRATKRAAGYRNTDDLHRAMSQFLGGSDEVYNAPTQRDVRSNLIALDAARGGLNFDEVDALEKSIEFTNQLKNMQSALGTSNTARQVAANRLAQLSSGNAGTYTPEELNQLKAELTGQISGADEQIARQTAFINEMNQAVSRYQPTVAAIKPEAAYSTKPLLEYLAPKPAAPTDNLYRGGIAALRR